MTYYIYVISNPSFEKWVKVGVTDNVNGLIDRLNSCRKNEKLYAADAIYEANGVFLESQVINMFNGAFPSLYLGHGCFMIDPEDACDFLDLTSRLRKDFSRLSINKRQQSYEKKKKIVETSKQKDKQRPNSSQSSHVRLGNKMEKADLIELFQNAGYKLNSAVTAVSSHDKCNYWATPSDQHIYSDWSIILNDTLTKTAYLFSIKAHTLHYADFVHRYDDKHENCLNFDFIYGSPTFRERHSGVDFLPYYVGSLCYGENPNSVEIENNEDTKQQEYSKEINMLFLEQQTNPSKPISTNLGSVAHRIEIAYSKPISFVFNGRLHKVAEWHEVADYILSYLYEANPTFFRSVAHNDELVKKYFVFSVSSSCQEENPGIAYYEISNSGIYYKIDILEPIGEPIFNLLRNICRRKKFNVDPKSVILTFVDSPEEWKKWEGESERLIKIINEGFGDSSNNDNLSRNEQASDYVHTHAQSRYDDDYLADDTNVTVLERNENLNDSVTRMPLPLIPDKFSGYSIISFEFRGEKYTAKAWKDALDVIMNYLYSKYPSEIYSMASSNWFLSDDSSVPFLSLNEEIFTHRDCPRCISNSGIYFKTNYSVETLIKIMKRMLTLFNEDLDQLVFTYE